MSVSLMTLQNVGVTLKSILVELLQSFLDVGRVMKNSSDLTHTVSAAAEHSQALPSRFSSYPVNKSPSCSLFSARFFFFFCIFVLFVDDFAV